MYSDTTLLLFLLTVELESECKARGIEPFIWWNFSIPPSPSRALSDALKQLLNYLPGQIEYEKALKSLQDAARALDPKKVNFVLAFTLKVLQYLSCMFNFFVTTSISLPHPAS